MPGIIKVDPLTRIEGHLKAEYEVHNNVIENARVAGTMYRGFESFLKGRHPFDAVRITQRVCGVCHEVHGVASCKAVEKLYAMNLPYNGLLLRELILGLSIISDHILHFYQLLLPDYADFSFMAGKVGYMKSSLKAKMIREKELTKALADNYKEAVRVRGSIGEALAVIGGKTPFCHALLPGGVTSEITPDKLLKIRSVLNTVHDFLHECMEKDVHLLASYFGEYFSEGESYGRFICGESFVLKSSPLYRAGVYRDGRVEDVDVSQIMEDISKTYLDDKNIPAPSKKGAYSWIKTPTYGGSYFEVGPLARAVISGSKRYAEAVRRHGKKPNRSSVMNRIVARMTESQEMAGYMLDILGGYLINLSTINDPDLSLKVNGEGEAVSIASRGMLYHKLAVKDGKMIMYNMIVPSTWNFGPGGREPGVVEKALNGSRITREDSSVVAGRIIRSFDPCIACAVH